MCARTLSRPRCAMPSRTSLRAGLGGVADQLVEHRHEHVQPLDGEALLAGEGACAGNARSPRPRSGGRAGRAARRCRAAPSARPPRRSRAASCAPRSCVRGRSRSRCCRNRWRAVVRARRGRSRPPVRRWARRWRRAAPPDRPRSGRGWRDRAWGRLAARCPADQSCAARWPNSRMLRAMRAASTTLTTSCVTSVSLELVGGDSWSCGAATVARRAI